MKHRKLVLFVAILLSGFSFSCRPGEPTVLEPENFNFDWLFYRAEGTPELPPADAQWEAVDLPHTAHIEPLVILKQWQGISFYKKNFELEEKHRDKELFIKFEAAMKVAEVWVNGLKMFFNFNFFGGIYRNTYMIAKNRVHITNANGRLSDVYSTRVGLREIRITNEGMWLNGEPIVLRGVNRHQEYPYVGYAMSDAAQFRDAYKIKHAGFDLASILAWELSLNETDMPQWFTEAAHAIGLEEFPYPGNYTAGWVRHPYDIYIEARQHRHNLYPELPLLVSEYGDWEYYAQNAGLNQHEWGNLLPYERNSRQARDAGEKRLLQKAFNVQEAIYAMKLE